MNTVNLVGKIIRKQETGKVTYITISCRASRETEFISITSFQTDFISKYFPIGKWIGVRGHIHINKVNNEYITEIISDDLYFVGDKTETTNADNNRGVPDELPTWDEFEQLP